MNTIPIEDQHLQTLLAIAPFVEMNAPLRAQLPAQLDMRLYEVGRGEVIATQGQLCRHLYVLLSGMLEVHIIDAMGNEVFIEHLHAPRVFATPHLFKEDNRMPATFRTVEDTLLLTVTRDSTFALISHHPEVLRSFLCIAGNCNQCTTVRLDVLSRRTVRERLLVYLFSQKPRGSVQVAVRQTVSQLAAYLNVSRSALSTEISKMEKEGLLTRHDGRFELHLDRIRQPI